MVLGKLDIHMQKKKKNLDPYITRHTKINTKWIKNLNMRTKILTLRRKLRKNLHDLGFSADFLYMTPKTHQN